MTPAQEALVLQNDTQARRIAGYIARRLPRQVEMDDLVQNARLGLCDAALRWKPETGVPFKFYANRRIHGAILDALRGEHHLTGLGRRGKTAPITQLSALEVDGFDAPSADDVEARVFRAEIGRAIAALERRQRFSVQALLRGHTMAAVGVVLAVSESRVSQLVSEAHATLRRELAA